MVEPTHFWKTFVKNGIIVIFPGIFQNLWNPPTAKTPRMCKRIAICFATSAAPIFFVAKKKKTPPLSLAVSSLQVYGLPPWGFFSPATSSACSLTRASCCNWLAPEASISSRLFLTEAGHLGPSLLYHFHLSPSVSSPWKLLCELTLFSSSWYFKNWFPK